MNAEFEFLVRIFGDMRGKSEFCGTGILATPNCVLTCRHVVENLADVKVRTVDSNESNVSNIRYSSNGGPDLAVLELNTALALSPITFLSGITKELEPRLQTNNIRGYGYPKEKKGETFEWKDVVITKWGLNWSESGVLAWAQPPGSFSIGVSGGPVLVNYQDHWIILGVLSHGQKGAATTVFIAADAVLEVFNAYAVKEIKTVNAREVFPPLRTDLGLALDLLNSRLYSEAKAQLQEAIKQQPTDSSLFYYLALACCHGKSPDRLTLSEIKKVEKYLQSAIALDNDKGHFYYLSALIREYYEKYALNTGLPSIENLINRAGSLEVSPNELMHLLKYSPAPDSPITKIVLWRIKDSI